MPCTAPNPATSQRQLTACRAQTAGTIRQERFDGDDYTVIPFVGMVPGVRNQRLVMAEELSRYVEAWNGRPVVVDHPIENGTPVTANQTRELERRCIGQIFNARFDGRLKGEMWINVRKARDRGFEDLAAHLQSGDGHPLEVSVGYFSDIEPVAGTHEGMQYHGIDRNLRPDHIAILPHDRGSCSVDDGCGAPRINQDRGEAGYAMRILSALGKLISREQGNPMPTNTNASDPVIHQSHRKLEEALNEALRREAETERNAFVLDVMPDEGMFVYKADQMAGPVDTDPFRIFRRPYEVSGEGVVSLGTPIEEMRESVEVEYVPVDEPVQVNKEEQTSMDRKTTINGLIANSAFTEQDRGTLEKMTDEQLSALCPHQKGSGNQADSQAQTQPQTHAQSSASTGAQAKDSGQQAPQSDAQAGNGSGQEANSEASATPQTHDSSAPSQQQTEPDQSGVDAIQDESLRSHVKSLLEQEKQERQQLIDGLVAHKGCDFTKEELGEMRTETLRKTARGLHAHQGGDQQTNQQSANTDYSAARPAPKAHEQDSEGPPAPPQALVAQSQRSF